MDYISRLPDPILCHILSFLPNQFAARTSLLARRWRLLWTNSSDLCFNQSEYYASSSQNSMCFSDMIDRVLLLHHGPLDGLIIQGDDGDIHELDLWLRVAIARKIQVLSLSDIYFEVPQYSLSCNTLIELTLSDCFISVEPHAVCFPRLKKLHLHRNFYRTDESLRNFLSGCSAINSLLVEIDKCGQIACCYICSPTVKSLVLWLELSCPMLDHDYEHRLVLDVPAVQYLEIRDNFSHIIQSQMLSSLVVAKISFFHYCDPKANISHWREMFQFFEKLSNAKSLTFTSSAMMKLLNPIFSFATTRFRNLTKLELEADWHFLNELFECAAKLESLTIREVISNPRKHVNDELKCWREPKHFPKCLLSSLEYVSVLGYAGGEHELNLVRYILGHAKVLKRMEIDTGSHRRSKNSHSKQYMLKRILDFPRESTECHLDFI